MTQDPADSEPTLLGEVLSLGPRLAGRTIAQIQASQQLLSLLRCAGSTSPDTEAVERAAEDHAMAEPVDVLGLIGTDTADEHGNGAPTGRQDPLEDGPSAPVPPSETGSDGTDEFASTQVPDAIELVITGYDSLAASQVVPRLTTLSNHELRSIGAYEQANRGRRTILNRVRQLLATADGDA